MKTQSSLEVPKQVRSASFDEIQLEAKRALQHQSSESSGFLTVPSHNQRSKSFDSGGNTTADDPGMFLEVPARRFPRRRSSGDKAQPYCVHCVFMEEYTRLKTPPGEEPINPRSFSDTSTSEDVDSDSDHDEEEEDEDLSTPTTPQCCITVTLSPNPAEAPDSPPPHEEPSPSTRRRSITSPKLERQEAFIFNESVLDSVPDSNTLIVNEVFLTVPELKRDRAASVDSCFINKSPSGGKAEEIEPAPVSTSQLLLQPPPLGPASLRSRSVDIVLPTDEQARYKALAMTNTARTNDKGYVTHCTLLSISVFIYLYNLFVINFVFVFVGLFRCTLTFTV